jgi:hypothetical protein
VNVLNRRLRLVREFVKCIGAAALRPTADGSPDVIWAFLDKLCVCFEAKTEKGVNGLIYKKDLEEAKLHPDWAKHHLQFGSACEFASIIVSSTRTIDKIAAPFVQGLFFLFTANVRSLASSVVEILRKLRAKFADSEYSDVEKEFAAEITSAKLDYNSLRTFLTKNQL